MCLFKTKESKNTEERGGKEKAGKELFDTLLFLNLEPKSFWALIDALLEV